MIILLLTFVLIISILSGCKKEELPNGIENKAFFKDLEDFHSAIVQSMRNNTYYEEEIEAAREKINNAKYIDELNMYELSLLLGVNSDLSEFKEDVERGTGVINSTSIKEIEEMINIMSSYYEKKIKEKERK